VAPGDALASSTALQADATKQQLQYTPGYQYREFAARTAWINGSESESDMGVAIVGTNYGYHIATTSAARASGGTSRSTSGSPCSVTPRRIRTTVRRCRPAADHLPDVGDPVVELDIIGCTTAT
jgi:hypothetical protein